MNKRLAVSRNCRIAGLALALVAVTVAVLQHLGLGSTPWWSFALLVGAVAATEAAEIRFVVGSEVWILSLTEVFLAVALVINPGGWIALACAVGVMGLMAGQRQRSIKVFFNTAQFAFASAAAALTSSHFGASVLGAALAIIVFIVVNFLLVALAIQIATSRSMRNLLDLGALIGFAQSLGSASVGLLAGWLTVHAPIGLVGLLVPVGLIWYSYRAQLRQAAETRMFSELASGHEQITGPSTDTSARVIASAAHRLLSGEVELVVLSGESPVRYSTDGGAVECRHVEQTVLSEAWVLEALGSDSLSVGLSDRAPYLVARLGGSTSPNAVLRVVRPVSSVLFERRDQMMASILFRQADSWLAMVELTEARDEAVARAEMSDAASRVIGDMGAETFPALVRLRESAVRLTRLANTATGRDGVGDIVEELHAAERAVASLLGAIAMAADSQLAADDVIELPSGNSMGDNDWTTTGTLDLEAADGAL